MSQNKTDIADLLADESFINYCKKTSDEDIAYWGNYISRHPQHRELVELAREKFLLLFNVLAETDKEEQLLKLKNRLSSKEAAPVVKIDEWKDRRSRKEIKTWMKFAGAAVFLLIAGIVIVQYLRPSENSPSHIFITNYGERKKIQLPDGSVVKLNAGSKLSIDKDFGVTTRNVHLKGEAFFDVKHDPKNPFIVHTPAMDIKALGTAFDVKAYSNEKTTEASLICGLIEVTLKENDNQVVLLHPNHKIAWEHKDPGKKITEVNQSSENSTGNSAGIPEKLKTTNRGEIKEIAWKENRLLFENDSFNDIAFLLERWYGVHIQFADDAIRAYCFTGAFQKEDLPTVLNFLKESKHFNFRIETNEITTVYLSK